MYRLWPPLKACFWDLHSLTWDGGVPPTAVTARTAAVLNWAQAHAGPGARILDVGCATGTHALALALAGFRVLGVDHSGGMLRRAQAKVRRHPGATVTFSRAGLSCALPPEFRAFDLVLCLGVIQCVADPVALLTALRSALAPGEMVLVEVKDAAAPPPVRSGYSV